jgi:hypothetical protein
MMTKARIAAGALALAFGIAALPQRAGAPVLEPDPPGLADRAGQCLAYDVVVPGSRDPHSRGDLAELLRRGLLLRGMGEADAFRRGMEHLLAEISILRQIPPDRHPSAESIRRACERLVRVCLTEWASRGAEAARGCAQRVQHFWSE